MDTRDEHAVRRGRRRSRLLAGVATLAGAGVAAALIAAPASAADQLRAGTYTVSFTDAAATDATVEALALDPLRTYDSVISGFTAELTAEQATTLAAAPEVLGIQAEQPVIALAETKPPAVGAVEADKPPVSAGSSRPWPGPNVAVLDSGVSLHTDLNRAGAINCLSTGTEADGDGHGTGVSGVLGAIDNETGILGIAPGVPIYSARVLDDDLLGTVQTLMCGLEWVSQNADRYDLAVVNMSISYPGTDDGNCGYTNGDTIHQAICSLTRDGVSVVAGAGNSGKDLAGTSPANYDEVLAVTNMADYDGKPGSLAATPCADTTKDDTYVAKSNFAVSAADQAHTVAAPGACPYTTKKGNRYGYVASGTSMATAAATGVVLGCYAYGPCSGRSTADVISILRAQASAAAARGHVFTGDPTRPVAGRY